MLPNFLDDKGVKGNCREEKKERLAGIGHSQLGITRVPQESESRGCTHSTRASEGGAPQKDRPHSEAQPQSILGFPRVQLFLEDFSDVSAGSGTTRRQVSPVTVYSGSKLHPSTREPEKAAL